VLQWVLDGTRRPRSAEEDEAGRPFILGEISLGQYRSRH